ncbi:MAG: hypothetical protein WDO19_17150 [Bacteroidota bacterium]
MRHKIFYIFFTALFCAKTYGQEPSAKHTFNELTDDIYHSLLKNQALTGDSAFFQRSEAGFKPYAGKLIRNIKIQKLKFGENIFDTSMRIAGALSRVANNLQTGSKSFIIRQFLFLKSGQTIDPYRLADNERLLRNLDFIKDARIQVIPAENSPDSADVLVTVRDVFSIGVKADASAVNDFSGTLYDANLFGRAQRLEYTLLFDKTRHPTFGSNILFRKYNLFGSFVNADIAYSTINRGAALGKENETSVSFNVERPLYTPSAKFAGGMNLSWNHSVNSFKKPDSLFLDYDYRLQDVWVGYNIGVKNSQATGPYQEDSRRRMFAAVRYYDQSFLRKPTLDNYDYAYRNKVFLLSEFSWYKLDFYRTNYIYGFGITEDVPVGFSRKIVAGYSKIDSLERLYLGWQYDHWLVSKKENFYNYTLALGTNYYKGSWQDNSLLFNFSWFSRLFSFSKFRIRQNANFSYAGIGNFKVYNKLGINNEYGIEQFNTDSVRGLQRMTFGMETSLFTNWQILGFEIAFFTFGKASLVAPQHIPFLKGDIYSAAGGGFRMRNENLILGTIESRFTWFPRTLDNIENIKITFSGNIRFKFPASFIQAPWFASLK